MPTRASGSRAASATAVPWLCAIEREGSETAAAGWRLGFTKPYLGPAVGIRHNFNFSGQEMQVQIPFEQRLYGFFGGAAAQQPFVAAFLDPAHRLPVFPFTAG